MELSRGVMGVRFMWRWAWFLLLSVLLSTICSYFIPDFVSSTTYRATLQVQVHAVAGTSVQGKATTTFFAGLLQSPGVLDLALTRLHVYPQFKAYVLADLQDGRVTATVIKNTNIVQLIGYADSSRDAALIVSTVYNALIQSIQRDRAQVIDAINARLNAELVQVQTNMLQTRTTLEQLKTIKQATSSQYSLLANEYGAQKQRMLEINAALAALKHEGYDNLLGAVNSTPAITTLLAVQSTMDERLALSPLVGLIMGLGGVFVASRLAKGMLKGSRKRISAHSQKMVTVPMLSLDREQSLQSLMDGALHLQPLLRRVCDQSSEDGRQPQVVTITSSCVCEGKSTIAACLAIAAASSGLKTILVDANPHRPVVHTYFQVPEINGTVSTIQALAQGIECPSPLWQTLMPGLVVLPIGQRSESRELWGESFRVDGLQSLMAWLHQQTDFIVCDGPAFCNDANIPALLGLADATVLVVDAEKVGSAAALEAEACLAELCPSSMVVINRALS